MAQSGYTPISLYYSTTASAAPTSSNLVAGELALNTVDEKLYFKNSAGTVKLLASNAASAATVSSVAMSVPAFLTVTGSPITSSGTLAVTYSGTALPIANGGTGVTASTGTTSVVLSNSPTLTNPTVTNYVETPYTANSSTAITLALTNGTVQIITLTGNATITMPTATSGKSFILLLKQDATGSRTVTWSTVKWPGGTAPTITSTASKQDIFSFFADGTNWYGVTVSQNYTP